MAEQQQQTEITAKSNAKLDSNARFDVERIHSVFLLSASC